MASATALRIAVIAAFPFPLQLGSQIFVRDQLRALRAAGADPTLLCYGTGSGETPPDLDVIRSPAALSAIPLRAGPSLWKPVSDAALTATYVAANRRRPFDLALAHNGEAALAALAARRVTGVPVVYAAHTLLGRELPSWGPARLRGTLERFGSTLDRFIAGSCDGVLALCDDAGRSLGTQARGPTAVIPPGFEPRTAPDLGAQRRACERLGLRHGEFALYSGNLDAYQDLAFLGSAAERVPDIPVVVATHAAPRALPAGLHVVRVRDYDEMRDLVFAARVAVCPRRIAGGFPIKLLGYMEAARAIVAVRGVADGLEHERSAWLLDPGASAGELAAAIRTLASQPERAARLGRGARDRLLAHHRWDEIARRTLELGERASAPSFAAA